MAHLAHYKRSGAAPMLAHYERRAELERGYSRENIDASRTAENYAIGAGSPQALAAALRSRVDDAIAAHEADSGKAIRKDANVIGDWVVTLPKNCPRGDARKFFETAVDVCRARYGAENVLGGFVHMDETTPHVHVPVVPVKDGRIRAAKVFTRSDLQRFHKDLGRAEDAALGRHVSVELDPAQQGEKQLSHLGQAEYMAAKDEARKASEKASEARKAAETAERVRRAAESRKRDSEAAAEASERARKQAESAAEAAKKDLETQRRRAKQLGPEGKGIDWRYTDGHVEHESSVGEVRTERDAAEKELAAAQKRLDLQKRESAALDSWKKSALASLSDAQDKASRAEARAAKAEADRKAAEAAKTQAEASLSSLRDSVRQSQEAARTLSSAQASLRKVLAETEKARQERDRYAREKLIDWTEIDSAIAEVARYVATVVVSLWDSARDFAVSVWRSWRSGWGLTITSGLGYSKQNHENVCDEQMAEVCEEQRRPDIAHALGVGDEREERGYDDWER